MDIRIFRVTTGVLTSAIVLAAAGVSGAASYRGVEYQAEEFHGQTHALGEMIEARLSGLPHNAALRGDVRVMCVIAERIRDRAADCGNVNALVGDARTLERRVGIMQRHLDLMGRDVSHALPCVQEDYAMARCRLESLANQACALEAMVCELKEQQLYARSRPHVAYRLPSPPPPAFGGGHGGHHHQPPVGVSLHSGGRQGTDICIRIGGFHLHLDD